MKLDKVRYHTQGGRTNIFSQRASQLTVVAQLFQDNSGTIEREEFLSLPQINSNPLATRYVSTLACPRGHLSCLK